MASITMATAAGAAFILYYSGYTEIFPWQRRVNSRESDELIANDENISERVARARRIRSQTLKPSRPPSTWTEAISMLAETLRFTYSETLGKWPIADLAFGINFLLRRQSKSHVEAIYAGEDSDELRGKETLIEMKELFRLITICYAFSKKTLDGFVEETGFKKEDVIFRKASAELLKPAYAIVLDRKTSHVLVIIRGTHSMKDTLTAVTGATVPFHHTLVDRSGASTVRQLILGYAHCGMVAAARSIAKHASPVLLDALKSNPGFKIKIIGHSLGGGTASLLTFVLREKPEFYETTCVTFAPAACMTWELAESGLDCVTSLINGADVIPTFSAASVDDLRSEVTASAWVDDFREQMEKMRILKMVMNSAISVRNRLSVISTVTYNLAGFGRGRLNWRREGGAMDSPTSPPASPLSPLIWRAASTGKQIVHNVQTSPSSRPNFLFNALSCMGVRRRIPFSHPLDSIENESTQNEKNDSNISKSIAMDVSFIQMKMKREDSIAKENGEDEREWNDEKRLSSDGKKDEEEEEGMIEKEVDKRKKDRGMKINGDLVLQGSKINGRDCEHVAGLAVLIDAMRRGQKRQKKTKNIKKRLMKFDPLSDLRQNDVAVLYCRTEEGGEEADESMDAFEENEEGYSPMYRDDSERIMKGGKEWKEGMEEYSWQELEEELERNLQKGASDSEEERKKEEEEMVRKMCEEEEEVLSQASGMERSDGGMDDLDDFLNNQKRFFPCGRILHMIKFKNDESASSNADCTAESDSESQDKLSSSESKKTVGLKTVERKSVEENGGLNRTNFTFIDTGLGLERFSVPAATGSGEVAVDLETAGTSVQVNETGNENENGNGCLDKTVDLNKPEEQARSSKGRFGIFLTSRKLYGRVRLSRTMVMDHFMPTYKKSMLDIIEQMENEESKLNDDGGNGGNGSSVCDKYDGNDDESDMNYEKRELNESLN